MNRFIVFLLTIPLFFSCEKEPIGYTYFDSYEPISQANYQLTDVMLDNIFPPTVAARNYAYSNIAAYQVFALLDSSLISLKGKVNGLYIAFDAKDYPLADKYLSSLCAFYYVANHVTFPEGSFIPYLDTFLTKAKQNHFSSNVVKQSKKLAKSYTDKFIAEWTAKDNYAETRSAPKHPLSTKPGEWIPTPPGYFQAIEPNWNEIRPLCLDSSDEIIMPPPPKFSIEHIKSKQGMFAEQTYDLYYKTNMLSEEQKHIADFWDCNPYAIRIVGHVNYSIKKISPGGHWISIASIACKQATSDYKKSLITHTLVSIALFDAFLSCWDEKYRSDLVRPETIINKHIDRNWKPYLQTPPFPSYTSGHSCISTAAATILTNIYGDSFPYTDNSELEFGIPNRNFSSFIQASEEASISRFYGGIHYMFDIDVGITQGKMVAEKLQQRLHSIINKIKTKHNASTKEKQKK